MSFDVEVCNPEHFPKSEDDPVITIGFACKLHNSRKEDLKVVFQLDTCDDILDADVHSFKTEIKLFDVFDEFILAHDPGIIFGDNIIDFDFSYLFNRKQAIKKGEIHWGRLREEATKLSRGRFQSKVMGFRETVEINIEERVQVHMMIYMLSEKKLISNTLNYKYTCL
jgi:DNA polymerase delta subunit 1